MQLKFLCISEDCTSATLLQECSDWGGVDVALLRVPDIPNILACDKIRHSANCAITFTSLDDLYTCTNMFSPIYHMMSPSLGLLNHAFEYLDVQVNRNKTLWNPEVQCRIHKGSPIISTLSRIDLIPGNDTYSFNQSSSNDLIPRHAVAVMHSGQ